MKSPSGIIVGYDPGGNKAHGVAMLVTKAGNVVKVSTSTLETIEQVITLVEGAPSVLGLGIDTLTCWSTGPSGWRPADRWLRSRYQEVADSVMAPNGLRGSMAVSGMALLMAVRPKKPDLSVTEAHPKVLCQFLAKARHDFIARRNFMNDLLAQVLGVSVIPSNEHEWDAAISAFAALEGLSGRWTHDLHRLDTLDGERLLKPCGPTHYWWPE